jgi:hypothetical protein
VYSSSFKAWEQSTFPELILTPAACLWSTLINVMRTFSAITIIPTSIAGAVSIPAIRITGHNVRAGIGA